MSTRCAALFADAHGHAKGEHRPFVRERPISYTPRMLFLWLYHAARRGRLRALMVTDHINLLTAQDPQAVDTARRAVDLAREGDVIRAAQTADVAISHAEVVSEALKRGLRFSIGVEADNDPRTSPDAPAILGSLKPDRIIRSIHFLPLFPLGEGVWPFDNPEFAWVHDRVDADETWRLYVNQLLDDVERLPTDIVGHFYVPAKFGHWPSPKALDEHEDRLLSVCRARRLTVEFNTRLLYRSDSASLKATYLHAHRRLLAKARAWGVPISLGSDAHRPQDQGGAFDVAIDLLESCGIDELAISR